MQKIKFLGASGEVTGSSYLVTSDASNKLLIDFGMFQGIQEVVKLNYEKLEFKPSELSGVALTHAHLDHCGRLPLLVFGGFMGKIYMTAPTRALVEIVLTDAAKVGRMNPTHEALFNEDQVAKVLSMIEVVEYGKEFSISDFTITFRDAGHILGSASIEVVDASSKDKQKMVFSGDLGNYPEDIVKPTEFISNSDIVVMESTYGDKPHPDENVMQILQEEINAVERTGGVLLIPAFSLERTQELLHKIHHLKKDRKINEHTPVFLDSPMGIHATVIFHDFKQFYNEELQKHSDDPFDFEGLVVTEDVRDSKEIIKAMNPKVIIAGSGMMSGGRIMHHAMHYLPRETTRVLFVGYQAEETIGRAILEGAKSVIIDDKHIQVKAKIRQVETLSSHADQPKLLNWLKYIQGVKKVFLVHGDVLQRKIFYTKVKELGINEAYLPQNGEEFIL